MTLRLLICGTRTFADYALLCRECDAIEAHYSAVEVVTGAPDPRKRGPRWKPGADGLGERWALARGHAYRRFPADWRRYGRSAGPIRNREMLAYLLQSTERRGVVAFWDGVSPGTGDMIRAAREGGVGVRVVSLPGPRSGP